MPEMPEWVQVWSWLRFLRDPRDLTPLPHQGDDPKAMSHDRYSEFHHEWVEAGRPALSVRKIVAAMSGSVAIDVDDDIPF